VQIKDRQKLLVFGAVAVVVLFAGQHLVYNPLASAYTARAKAIQDLRKRVNNGKMLIQRAPGITNQWNAMLRNTLTNDQSAAEQQVFRAIDSWSQNSGAIIGAITPQWKQDAEAYSTYECRVEAAGDLRRLSRFLYDAERAPLALRLQSVELGARDKEGSQLTLGLQFSALVLQPQQQSARTPARR
jgi:hypothetical protein